MTRLASSTCLIRVGDRCAAVVTANPGCEMQLAAGLRAGRSPATVMHLMDLLDLAYGPR
ncbi:MAG: hypothetical protein H0U00_13005 [Actinobacteria bacterium]|nr:hypothetical protein [Actinomycetota bacterium]